jgi:hypothetical protein
MRVLAAGPRSSGPSRKPLISGMSQQTGEPFG